MQEIIVAKPYKFIPPHRGNWIPTLIQRLRLIDWYLNRFEGIASYEVRGIELLKDSLDRGHGILLAPNHCRYADPVAMGWIARSAGVHVFAMASWHLFHQGRLQSFAMRMCGAFSVYREGADRQSLDTAVDILAEATRPLIIFPEGTVFRTNDQLHPLLDGVAFLARSAARKRAKAERGTVVIHPVGIKYVLRSDVRNCVEPVIEDLEGRFLADEAKAARGDLLSRVASLEEAILREKEIQYLGQAQAGCLPSRRTNLIAHLMEPTEAKWLGRTQTIGLLPRIKQLRCKMMPHLISTSSTPEKIQEIWEDLAKIYLAQQLASYPDGYLDKPTDMRLLETVERIEEDVTDRSRIHRPLHAILQVDHPIEVEPERPERGKVDPLMGELTTRLQSMLDRLTNEAKPL
jgi:1-acyl-sn-glycerol-3-phosphate acyltransferase